MKIRDLFNWLKKSLLAQKLRALLTITGFATGAAAVVLMTAVGDSLRLYILDEFTQFGSNIIAITPGKTQTLGLSGILNTIRPLSLADAEYIQAQSFVEFAVPVVMGTAKIKAGGRSRHTEVAGIGSYADKAWKLKLASGRFLPHDALQTPRSFAVLGSKLKKELFAKNNALGEYIHVGSQRFTIIGVLEEKGQFMGTDLDDMIYIPTARAMQLFNRESLMELDIFYRNKMDSGLVVSNLKQLLSQRHGMEDFTIVSQDDMLATLSKILNIVKNLGIALGSISLFVGAVSITTIMTITVSERAWEIGLLRAIGFSAQQIRQLFLAEAALLALISGLLGYLVIAVVLVTVNVLWPQVPIELNPTVLIMTVLVSTSIGLLAGLKPANQAASLLPVDALRAK
jgi:putative ABC transport system permease protein